MFYYFLLLKYNMENQFVGSSQNIFGQASNRFNKVLDTTELSLGNLLSNTYVSVSLKVFLALYAAFVAPEVPKNFAIFMDSTIIRVIFAALIVYSAIHDPVTAILLAIVFIITLQTAAKYKIYSTSESVLVPGGISWLPSAKQGAVLGNNYQIGNKFVGGVENVVGGVMGGVENVAGGVMGGVQDVGQGVVGGVQNLGGGFVGGVQNLGGGFVGGVRQVGSGLIGGVQELGGGMAGGVRQVGSGLIGGVQDVGQGVVGGISRLGGCLVDSAQDIGTGLVGGVQKVGSGLVGGAQQFGNSVVGGSQYVGSGLIGGVQDLGTGVVGGVRQVGSGLMSGVRQVGSSVSGGVRSVIAPMEHMENPVPSSNELQFAPFTSEEQFNDIESNFVPGSNQDNCVQTFANQFCAQGMQSNWVQGF